MTGLRAASQACHSLFKSSIIILLTMLSLSGAVRAQEWLSWRGPQGDGIVRGAHWNPKALDGGPTIKWRVDVGKGHSSVAVRGNHLWTMGNRAESKDAGEDIILCLDTETGSAVWEYAFACKPGEYPGPYSTPVIDGNRIYAVSRGGDLHCLNTETGELIWKRGLLEEGLTSPQAQFSASPLVYENILLLNQNSSGMAFDKMTGDIVWNSPVHAAGFASPYRFVHKGKTAVAMPRHKKMHVIRPESGEVLWQSSWSYILEPLVFDNKMFCYNLKAALFDISGSEPAEIWSNEEAYCQFQGFVRFGQYAYGFGKNTGPMVQRFYCLDLASGQKKWQVELDQWGSLTGTDDGHLIIIQGRGELVIAKADPDGFKPVSRAQVMETRIPAHHDANEAGSHCWTNPVLSGGFIYVRSSEGELVCVDVTGANK